MKVYVSQSKKTPQQEMHLQVDHGLDPVELDESSIYDQLLPHLKRLKVTTAGTMAETLEMLNIAAVIIKYIQERGQA